MVNVFCLSCKTGENKQNDIRFYKSNKVHMSSVLDIEYFIVPHTEINKKKYVCFYFKKLKI